MLSSFIHFSTNRMKLPWAYARGIFFPRFVVFPKPRSAGRRGIKIIKGKTLPTIFWLFAFILSFAIMFGTFGYDKGKIMIGTHLWSDFAAHIPLIRSFSLGWNFPPEYPIFPNYPIHYHFLFYLIVGMLEKAGLRIDIALNILSTLSFFLLLIIIYKLTVLLFKNRAVGYLSVILFLFNGSFSFIEFFNSNSLKINLLPYKIFTNTQFPSWGPYDGKIVSAFWNLNIYTNQRHLALSFFLTLYAFYFFLKRETKKEDLSYMSVILIGLISGLCYFLNQSVFLIYLVTLVGFIIFFRQNSRKIILSLAITIAVALPQFFYVNSAGLAFNPTFKFGYLSSNNLTFFNFMYYWIFNLGINLITIPLGFYFASHREKKIFIIFFSFFILGNSFIFTPDIAANHKFFNFFMIAGSMFSAFALIKLWKNSLLRPFVLVLFILLTLSGFIEIFPIFNDRKIALPDYKTNETVSWIKNYTNPNSTFLNTSFLYDDASIAGRKIFLGWPYFPWSAGYNTNNRSLEIKTFFGLRNNKKICGFLKKNKIDYISLTSPSEYFPFDLKYWMANFKPIWTKNNNIIFSSNKICK